MIDAIVKFAFDAAGEGKFEFRILAQSRDFKRGKGKRKGKKAREGSKDDDSADAIFVCDGHSVKIGVKSKFGTVTRNSFRERLRNNSKISLWSSEESMLDFVRDLLELHQ